MANVTVTRKTDPFPCYLCNDVKETRPYGPGGKEICFDCMISNPILKMIAEETFGRSLG